MDRTHRTPRSSRQLWAGRDMAGLALAKPPPCPSCSKAAWATTPATAKKGKLRQPHWGHMTQQSEFLDYGVAVNKGAATHGSHRE